MRKLASLALAGCGVETATTAATGAAIGGNLTADGGSAVAVRGVVYGTATNPTTGNTVALATAGTTVVEKDSHKQPIQDGLPILASGNQPIASNPTSKATLDCGAKKFPDAIPYVVLLLLMLGTAIYQQRQMTKANPPSAEDAPMVAKLAKIGIVPGQDFDASKLDPAVAKIGRAHV